jgi:thioredoxin reductase
VPQSEIESLPVVVIGAGPVGLAAAAHLLERGFEPLVLERGDTPAAAIAEWGHVPLFSPWRYVVDRAAERLLDGTGWARPANEEYPTGAELREQYLLPLAATPDLRDRIQLQTEVVAVTRRLRDKLSDTDRTTAPFELVVRRAGKRERIAAQAVIDASGTYASPNPVGSSGLAAEGELELADRIAYGIPDVLADRSRYAGKRVLVVGRGHSAMNALEALVALHQEEPTTRIVWAVRRRQDDDRLFGGGENDALPARGALGRRVQALVDEGVIELATGVQIDALEETADGIVVHHGDQTLGPVDEIVACTGFRPDLDMLREIRIELDPTVEAPTRLAPMIDPNVHSCGTVRPHGALELSHPDRGFYIAGMKSYGRAPTFLLLTGYEQVRSITAAIAGDWEGAARVELELPETGVCNGPGTREEPVAEVAVVAGGGCCA